MTILKLKNSLHESFSNLIDTIEKFDDTSLNQEPFESSWTAGQVANHIIKSTREIPDQKVAEADRSPDEKVESLKNMFLDFSIKMESPEFILPERKEYHKEDIIKQIENIKVAHIAIIKSKDLSALCLDTELPVFGFLTRYEWLSFITFHTQRHQNQLEHIYKRLNKY